MLTLSSEYTQAEPGSGARDLKDQEGIGFDAGDQNRKLPATISEAM